VTTLDEVFADLRAGIPDLEGARCRGRTEWDRLDCPESLEFALSQCASCPALKACESWLFALPARQRPIDCVVAGRVRRPRKPRQRKETA
jgi:hypothetical protein